MVRNLQFVALTLQKLPWHRHVPLSSWVIYFWIVWLSGENFRKLLYYVPVEIACFGWLLLEFESSIYPYTHTHICSSFCEISIYFCSFLLSRLSLVCPIKNSKWSHKDLSKITYSINIAYSLVGCVLSIFLFVIVPLRFLDLANIGLYFNVWIFAFIAAFPWVDTHGIWVEMRNWGTFCVILKNAWAVRYFIFISLFSYVIQVTWRFYKILDLWK